MRRNSQKWIPFGFDTVSNKIVDIASVENGLSCNCICLICGTSLIAKQGKNQKWHLKVVSNSGGRSLHLGTDAGFHVFDVDGRFVLARMLLQGFYLAGTLGDQPVHIHLGQLLALWRSLVAGIG
ncbi:Uncharacterised protein [Klebsiella pneumoniae]|nr:Uncharacterised protein [Klebsiella pneumoniae]